MGKKKYFLVLDIETANFTEDALAYDIGYLVSDIQGNIYTEQSLLVYDIFIAEKEMMKSAYYADKIPKYERDLKQGKHKLVQFMTARRMIWKVMKKYNIKEVYAYNADFDYSGLNRTLRYLTKSKYRWFFPYGTEICCIWHIACQLILSQKRFFKIAENQGWFSKSGNLQTSAEIAFRYITKNYDFTERHTGLCDTHIEKDILIKCFQQHKKFDKSINRRCWTIPTKKYKEVCGDCT